ncbi:MAG: M1 family metallopeptidase [Actinomycetia bacterium]|nr:M1 family metallopeptidase [Actinomycetes bacterium]
MSMDPHRLPTDVVPEHYQISLDLDLEAERFSGTASITANATTPAGAVVLNADGLTVSSVSIRRKPSDAGSPCDYDLDAELERLGVHPASPIEAGPFVLDIAFEGEFNDHLVGPYLSRFTDDDGRELKLATTQFEATHARKCFPCWDEPSLKATFALDLTIDSAHDAVANSTEIARTELEGGRTRIDFDTTMVMSTYLVAFAAGPLEITDPIDVDGTPIRVVHVPGKGELTSFALDVATHAMRYFADYFALPYPGDKIDLVAIPDFGFGAMENLGCITFREVLLLIDPVKATQSELQRAADVVNHELAHMWFGDLVTMKWWNGLWLNEAFATFMEMKCTDAYQPEWQRWVDFSLARSQAFDIDALATTRPIEFTVVSPEDAESMFDVLTYEKGAAVVRMLEQYLGADEFRAGIRRYMLQHRYGNAETTDLWDAIESESGEPVRRIMDSWIFQGGFPLVSVSQDGPEVTFSQERMTYRGGDEAPDELWAAPILFRWQGDDGDPVTDRVLVDEQSTTVTLASTPDWLVANAESTGFLRVAYAPDQLDRLADVAIDELSAVERYAVLDDAYAALLAGRTSSMAFLNLIEAMSGEGDRSVWQRLIGGLRQLDRLVDGEAQERLQDIAHDILAPPLANLGLTPRDDDDARSRQLRGDLVRALGTVANDPEIQEEAKRTVAMGQRDPELVDAALMAASVEIVASIGDGADFNDYVEAWKLASTPQEEIRYLYALSDFGHPDLARQVHQLILDGEIRTQNAPFLLARGLNNRHLGLQTWEFIVEHWSGLNSLFASSSIVRMLSGISALDRSEQAEATAAFFDANPVSTGAKTLSQLLEKQRIHVALRQREAARFAAFLTAS